MRTWGLRVLLQSLRLALSALDVLAASASSAFKSRAALHLENLALRHQVNVLQRSVKRPKLTALDRFFWARLLELWSDWRTALIIVKPETVIAWHRKGFRLFWTWRIRHGQAGRPSVPKDVRELIRNMSRDNPLWGAPRIHGELLKLGIDVGETSVGKYMVRHRKPPSQTWRTFLDNHVKTMVSLWTSLLCRRSAFRSCTYSSCWPTTEDGSCISTSPPIPRRNGRPSNCGRPFPLTRSLDTCYATATAFSAAIFGRM